MLENTKNESRGSKLTFYSLRLTKEFYNIDLCLFTSLCCHVEWFVKCLGEKTS